MKNISTLLLLLIVTDSTIFSQTVTIGKQVWMAKNLDVSTFRNGDPIPEAKTKEGWVAAGEKKQPVWCYYENDPANGAKYGKLYNWYSVNDPRGLAPIGFHVASDMDFSKLTKYLGGIDKAGALMISPSGNDNQSSVSTNLGFSALPGGWRFKDGLFIAIEVGCFFWTSSSDDRWNPDSPFFNSAWHWSLHKETSLLHRSSVNKGDGFSVRCVKD